MASARALTGYCSNDFLNKKLGQKYCCKTSQPAPFTNCHWVGQQDCADNNCNNKEVTLRTDPGGDSSATCFCEFSAAGCGGSRSSADECCHRVEEEVALLHAQRRDFQRGRG